MAKAFHVYDKTVFIDDRLVLEYEANVEELDDKAAEYLILTEGGNKDNSVEDLTNMLLAAVKSDMLPQNIQVLIDNPLLNADKWSEEWDKWAKEILCMLCEEKDKGTISEEERRFLHKVYL